VFVVGLLLASTSASASPAMVTTTQGEVSVVSAGHAASAPPAPFLLAEGAELKLADGAQVVVLYDGTAKRLTGPATVSRASMTGGKAHSGAGRATSMLDDLLSVQHSQASAGAHRGGVALVRPLPGGDVLGLSTIRWRCDGCGEQVVEVVDFLEGHTVWTARGVGEVTYTGPALTGDSYQIAVGSERFTVYLADAGKRANLAKATQAATAPMEALRAQGDGVGEASVLSGLYAHIGLESDALWLLDSLAAKHPTEAGYAALAASLERRWLPAP
jgi:hypothetical protein